MASKPARVALFAAALLLLAPAGNADAGRMRRPAAPRFRVEITNGSNNNVTVAIRADRTYNVNVRANSTGSVGLNGWPNSLGFQVMCGTQTTRKYIRPPAKSVTIQVAIAANCAWTVQRK